MSHTSRAMSVRIGAIAHVGRRMPRLAIVCARAIESSAGARDEARSRSGELPVVEECDGRVVPPARHLWHLDRLRRYDFAEIDPGKRLVLIKRQRLGIICRLAHKLMTDRAKTLGRFPKAVGGTTLCRRHSATRLYNLSGEGRTISTAETPTPTVQTDPILADPHPIRPRLRSVLKNIALLKPSSVVEHTTSQLERPAAVVRERPVVQDL